MSKLKSPDEPFASRQYRIWSARLSVEFDLRCRRGLAAGQSGGERANYRCRSVDAASRLKRLRTLQHMHLRMDGTTRFFYSDQW